MKRTFATIATLVLLPLLALGQNGSRPPSLLVDVGARLIEEGASETLDRDGPVEDYIMGTQIVGTSQTRAKAKMTLVANPGPALLDLVISGTTVSETVGYNGPVRIYTTSTIPFRARKRLSLDKDGLKTDIWRGKVEFESQLNGISTCSRFDRIVRKVAYKKYEESRGDAEAIARERAEDQLVETLDKEVTPKLLDLHRNWNKRIAELKKHGVPTEQLVVRSTTSALEIRGVVPENPKSPAPAAPPKADLSVRLNEAFANQIGRSYAGKTIKGEDLEKDASGMFGPPPASADPKSKDDDTPWTVTFAGKDPISVVFQGSELMAVLRIEEFTSGDAAYSGMNVTAKYRFVDSPKGINAVRQGKLEIYPPGFISGVTKLSGRQQAMRTILEKRFGKVLTEEVKIKDIDLKDDKTNPTRLALSAADTRDGWLVIGWRQVGGKKQ